MRVRCGNCGQIYLIVYPTISTVSGVTHFEEQKHTCPYCYYQTIYDIPVVNNLTVA